MTTYSQFILTQERQMRIFLLIMINFIHFSYASDNSYINKKKRKVESFDDQNELDMNDSYQNYKKRCEEILKHIGEFEYFPKELRKIINGYSNPCISYEQWQKNNEELIEAAFDGKLEKVKELLESQEADVNAKDNSGETALMWAAKYGYKEIVELLINARADINAKNNYSETALIRSAFYGHKEIVELLINANADVNAKDNYGDTALKLAASYGHKEIVELLIKSKADINATNNYGDTALMWAAKYNHKKIVELLKKAGAK